MTSELAYGFSLLDLENLCSHVSMVVNCYHSQDISSCHLLHLPLKPCQDGPLTSRASLGSKNMSGHKSVLLSKSMCRLLIAACWKEDTHERPTFPVILQTLDDVARSKFHQMDDDNFYDLQDDWKAEIDETLHEIREREKVKQDTN